MNPSFFQRCSALFLSLALLFGSLPSVYAQTDLQAEVRAYLESREGLMYLDDILTQEALNDRFLQTLKDHRNEFGPEEEKRFLVEYFQLSDMPDDVSTALWEAIERFRSLDLGLTIEERSYLAEREARVALDNIGNLQDLKDRFLETLKANRNAFNTSSRLEAEAYLNETFDLRGAVPARIQEQRSAAVKAFLELQSGGMAMEASLTDEEMRYLSTRNSLSSLDDVSSLNQLEDRFVEVLKRHADEIDKVSELAILSYLDSYFDLTGEVPEGVRDRRLKAVKRFIAVTAGSLTPEQKSYLEQRGGMMMLDDIRDLNSLENRFLEALKIHRGEFEPGNAESYLVRYFDLTGDIPPAIIERIRNAVQRFAEVAHEGLTPDQKAYLQSLESADFDQVSSLDELVQVFTRRLKRHYQAVQEDPEGTAMGDVFQLGQEMEYLMAAYSMVEGQIPDAVMQAMRKAIALVRDAVGGEMGPQLPCPDCDPLKKRVRALEADKETAAQRARDLAEQFHDLKKRLNDALDQIIKENGCRPGQDVSGAESSATGLVYGRPFSCDSNAKVTDLTSALDAFWRNHRGSELDQDLQDTERRLKEAIGQVRQLTEKLRQAKRELDDCVAKAKLREECLRILGGLIAELDQEGDQEREIATSFTFEQPTDTTLRMPFRELNSSRLVDLSERYETVDQGNIDINRFRDLRDKPERTKRAIRYLTNRVPLFQGNEGGETFGADERVLRAVIAETLKRLGTMGEVEGYGGVGGDARPLEDVEAGVWFEQAMRIAIQNGVFKPQNNRVRPADDLNWAELVTVLRRFAGLEPIVPDERPFPSVPTGEWFSQEFATLKEAGLLDDFEDIDPVARPSKADLALIVHRMLSQKEALLQQ